MTRFIEHITGDNDRWDLLAWQYYGDATRYEQIIVANPDVPIWPLLPSGVKLLIPVSDEVNITAVEPAPWKNYGE